MKKSIDVFDFNEEDELAEPAAGKLLEKFANPSPCDSPVLQRQHIQSFSHEKHAKKEDTSCVVADTDVVVDNHCEDEDHDNHGLLFCLNTEDHDKEMDVDEDNHGLGTEDMVEETEVDHDLENFSSERGYYAGVSSYSQPQLYSSPSDSSSCQEQIDMMSAIDESLSDESASSRTSDSEGDEDWMSEHCLNEMAKIDRNANVIMSPEYVVLKDMPYPASLVIFSRSGIKVKSYIANNEAEEEKPFSCEFGVEDIVNIQHKWYQNVGLVMFRIRVLLKDEKCHEDMHLTTELEELRFTVKEHNWLVKENKIHSLNVKYLAAWELDCDVEVTEDNMHQQNRYFPRFDEPFEDVIYPKGEPDAVSIGKRDVDRLQPETFVNDTIIDFYINYLKKQIQAEERQKFHFFNSFFFRKLADLDKDPSSIADGKAAFQRVRKWTRKVDMFGKDYIFVPVNFNLHWSLLVICHPGEVANCTDIDVEDSTKVPCILHMDSIKGSHAGLKNLIQIYLCEEWKERNKETSDEISSRFKNLRFVSLELPQQQNSFDCGLFLLHYLELFLAEAPRDFSPFKLYNASNFLYLNWFPPAEASLKRSLIQKLISELIENRSKEVSNEEDSSGESPVQINDNTCPEILPERCTPLIDCNGNIITQMQDDDQGIEMTLLERSSMKNIQAVNDSGMVLRDLFDSGANNNTGSLLGQTFEQPSSFYKLNNALTTEEQFMCMKSREGTTSPRASNSYPSWNLSMMPEQKEGEEVETLSETSNSNSDDSEDVAIIEDTQEENIYEGESASLFSPTMFPKPDRNTEDEDLDATLSEIVVSSSEDESDEENSLELDLEVGDKTSNDIKVEDKTSGELGVDCDQKEETMEEEDENRAAKRLKLSPTNEVEKMEK